MFITHYSALYGANKSLLNLLEGLVKYGLNPLVVVPEYGDLCDVLEHEGIPYVIQEFNWWCGVIPNLPKSRRNKIKAIYKNWLQNKNLKKENKNHLISLKVKTINFKPVLIYSNSSVFNFGFLYSRKLKIPHFWHLREIQEHYDFKWFYNIATINRHFKQSEIVMAISEFVKKRYADNNKIKNIIVEYDGVLSYKDLLSLDEKRKNENISKDTAIVFGIIGLIHPNKGQEDAIRAFSKVNKRYPKTKLLIVGEGDQSRLQNLVNDLGITKNIEFWGHILDPFQAFLKMDVYLMCSRMEGMGRVTLEAMASGIPVIGYKEGGTIEIIQENITGLFYEKDYNHLSEKMIYLLENKEQRIKMGNKGRELFELKYTSEIYAKNFMEILESYKK